MNKWRNVRVAPQEFIDADDTELAMIVNGCGPGNWVTKLIPDRPLWIDFRPACSVHDFEYAFSGRKREADLNFLRNMMYAVVCCVKSSNWFLLTLQLVFGPVLALMYYATVSICGDDYFKNNKFRRKTNVD